MISEQSICSELSRQSAEQTDAALVVAINSAIGTGWLVSDLTRRLRSVRVMNHPQETILLDERPIMELWPIEMKTEQRGDSLVMVATRNYRILT